VPFDRHYLLLANLFDERRDDFIQLEAADFRDRFTAYGAEIERAASHGCNPLVAALPQASSVVVLLTSNFCELVTKPHPRDGREKIDRLTTEARRHFAEVVTLNDRWMFHLPFESVFARFFPASSAMRAMTQVVCTSSAALSLAYLYEQQCALGFGAPVVRRRFAEVWRSRRLQHEADLAAAIRLIRTRATSHRPASAVSS
jgi:hypothetical protein